MSFRPADDDVRERARHEHGTSFVLEAGAGTGKTTLLVDRIDSLIRQGTTTLDRIAAVTFTENAAATMKLRLRERLERARNDVQADAVERERAGAALDALERAQISTLHALCAAMLQERPLECGVVPGFRVADEAEADLLFADAWDEWLASRLEAGDDVLLAALAGGIPLADAGFGERTSLRGLARVLLYQRDLRPLIASDRPDPEAWRAELLRHADAAERLLGDAPEGDLLAAALRALVEFAAASRHLVGLDLLAHLLKLDQPVKRASGRSGNRVAWRSETALGDARRILDWARETEGRWKAVRSGALHAQLVSALEGVLARYEAKKSGAGVLDFLDLQIKARAALEIDSVRRTLAQRYRVVIIDEFQDTDPLQVEIAERLTGGEAGRLVVVGDPKQSIYRFRRAEARIFRRVAEGARRRAGHAVLSLTQNFRSKPAILRFVNRVFAELIRDDGETGQPGYEPIVPVPTLTDEPAVVALRVSGVFETRDELLRAEAAAVARFVNQAARGVFPVRDTATGTERPSRAGDVLVLARRLTQVRHVEEALERAGRRFVTDGGKSFFGRQEVHEALNVLRAIDDPGDRVAFVGALRSSFFGVSDRDIVAYVLAGGRLGGGSVQEELPGGGELAEAAAIIDVLHRERTRVSPAALVERLYDETRAPATLTGTRRGEAQVANLEKIVVLARQAADLGVLTLRGFADLLARRIREGHDEPDLPVARLGDPETVRILSIHKAKGLEAPLVVLFDAADELWNRPDVVPSWEEGTVAVGFRAGCQPPGWAVRVEAEKARIEAEGRRLLYVACTRARDLLVIPAFDEDTPGIGSFWKPLSSRLPRTGDGDVRWIDADTLPVAAAAADPVDEDGPAAEGDAVAARWDSERRRRLAEGSRRARAPISATRFAARTAPPPVAAGNDAEGRDFGRLVHRLLEWIPLDAGEAAVVSTAEALAPAFGLDAAAARRAADTVRRVLALPFMTRVRGAAAVWRELPVWFVEGEELVEGVIDLVFEEGDGLVVVDYKTDHVAVERLLDQAAHHAPQLRAYARGLARATGRPVRERVVLFASAGRAVPV